MSRLAVQELFEHVFDDEPPHPDAVPQVYRRAEDLRRRRARAVIAASAATVLLVALGGYGFASAVLPRLGPALAEGSVRNEPPMTPSPTAAVVVPGGVDRVQSIVDAELQQHGLDLAEEVPEQGDGWRRFRIVGPPQPDGNGTGGDSNEDSSNKGDSDKGGSGSGSGSGTGTGGADPERPPELVAGNAGAGQADNGGRSDGTDGATDDGDIVGEGDAAVDPAAVVARGTIHVAVYTTPGGLCFPVRSSSKRVCAEPNRVADGVEFARYTDDSDVDEQVNQVIARRRSDGRTVAVMVSGVPDTGDADRVRPPLTALEVAELALDRRLPDAFGSDEWCDRPDPDCPPLKVPLPDEG